MAHNPATLAVADERIRFVIDRLHGASDLGDERAGHWAATLEQAILRPAAGVLHDWFGDTTIADRVGTFQCVVHLDADGKPARITSAWMPGDRTVTEVRPTYVRLGGSCRDFAGMITAHSDAELWVGFTKMGDDAVQLVCFDR